MIAIEIADIICDIKEGHTHRMEELFKNPFLCKVIKVAVLSINKKFRNTDIEELFSEAKVQLLELIFKEGVDWDERTCLGFIYKHIYFRLFDYAKNNQILGNHQDYTVEALDLSNEIPVTVDYSMLIVEDSYLKELSPKQREVFVKFYLKGDTLQEIADDLGISVSSVQKHKNRSLEKIYRANERPIL